MRLAYGLLVSTIALVSTLACAQVEGTPVPPFVTTPENVVTRMLRLAGTGSTDLVVDLGSGDGRIVIAAAREFGARGMGLELDPKLVELSRENARAAGVAGRTEFRIADVLRADFSQASVVTVYLLPSLMVALTPVFLNNLKPGSRIVTHAFGLPGWKPDKSEKVKVVGPHPMQGDESSIFLWVVPAKARGEWRAASAEGEWLIRISQNFQEIEVEGEAAGLKLNVVEANLAGAGIKIAGEWGRRGEQFRFEGRVEEGRIAGQVELLTGSEKRVLPLVFNK